MTNITSYTQRISCEGFKFLAAVQNSAANHNRDIQTFAAFFDTEEEIMKHAQREFSKLPPEQQKQVISNYNE